LIASISALQRFANFRSTDTTKGVFDKAIQAQSFTSETADQSVGPAAAWLSALAQKNCQLGECLRRLLRRRGSLCAAPRGLSDAELRRLGLSRETLARDACARCDRIADH